MHFRAIKVEMLFAKKDDWRDYETLRFVTVGEFGLQLVDSLLPKPPDMVSKLEEISDSIKAE
jgi:hypothetical protein